jgi:hypothetical protein
MVQTSWSHDQVTPNLKYNPRNRKPGLIEPWSRGNLVSMNKRYWNKLGSRDNHIPYNPEYVNGVINPVNLQ